MTRDAEVLSALNEVYDPCSIAANASLGLVDMGLLIDHAVDGDHVRARLTVTGPGCMMAGTILKAATERLEAIDWVAAAEVEIVMGPLWTPARMSPAGAALLEARRRPAMDRLRASRPNVEAAHGAA